MHVWSSWAVVCEPWRSGGAAGVSHDNPRAQTGTFEGPGLQNTTKIQREDPPERKERMKFSAGERKKREILGGPGEGQSGGGGVRGRGPKILNTPTTHTTHNTHTTHTPPTSTNWHQLAPTGTNRHQQAPTRTTTTTPEILAKTLKH